MELSEILRIPPDRIYKWEQGKGTPKHKDRLVVIKWMNEPDWKNVPREVENSNKEGLNLDAKSSLSLLEKITDNNVELVSVTKIQADANKLQAEANKSSSDAVLLIAKSNEELVRLLKRKASPSIEDADRDSREARLVLLSDLLDVIAGIGSGKKRWKTIEEAREELNKFVLAAAAGTDVTDIPVG